MSEADIPQAVIDQYTAFRNKSLTFSQIPRKEYDAMLNNFIKYGLHKQKPRSNATFKSNLQRDEYLLRQRRYMQKWRAQHPGWNRKHQANWKDHQVSTLDDA